MRSRSLLSSLLRPSGISRSEFYESYWEKRPLLVSSSSSSSGGGGGGGKGNSKSSIPSSKGGGGGGGSSRQGHGHRLSGILSKSDVEEMVERQSLRYGVDLNVTRFVSSAGRRVTMDPPPRRRRRGKGKNGKRKKGKAADDDDNENDDDEDDGSELEPAVAESRDVWKHFDEGCTVRLLCPHMHCDPAHSLLSLMESELGCMVGSNAYLTPGPRRSTASSSSGGKGGEGGGCQGFAPHYDDIEAFVLQLEGRKRWTVYPPPEGKDVLPRSSSQDYTPEDVEGWGVEPAIDAILEPGDVLYMPRGWVHFARTLPPSGGGDDHNHSLHLTVSAYQGWCWSDLLEMILPEALDASAAAPAPPSAIGGGGRTPSLVSLVPVLVRYQRSKGGTSQKFLGVHGGGPRRRRRRRRGRRRRGRDTVRYDVGGGVVARRGRRRRFLERRRR